MASSSRNIDGFQCLKPKAEGYALELLNQIKSCTKFHKEGLLHTAKQLCSLKNTMISLKKHKHIKALISNYHTPFNKSVETQRRFYSTKKNNKRKTSKLGLCKPAWEEKNQILQIHYEGKFCRGRFFIKWWKSDVEWFWPLENFSKLKTTFCKNWTLVYYYYIIVF